MLTAGLELDRLPDRSKSQSPGHAIVEQVDVIVLKLDDLAAIDADQVVMAGLVEVVWIVGLEIATEVDFLDHAGLDQQGDGPVDRGPGRVEVLFADPLEELFGGEMFVVGERQAHDGIPLRGAPQTLLTDEGIQFGHGSFVHGWILMELGAGRKAFTGVFGCLSGWQESCLGLNGADDETADRSSLG